VEDVEKSLTLETHGGPWRFFLMGSRGQITHDPPRVSKVKPFLHVLQPLHAQKTLPAHMIV